MFWMHGFRTVLMGLSVISLTSFALYSILKIPGYCIEQAFGRPRIHLVHYTFFPFQECLLPSSVASIYVLSATTGQPGKIVFHSFDCL
jgi:hypothetical protein